MSGGITITSFVASAGRETKVYFVERDGVDARFACPIDGTKVTFAESAISYDAHKEPTLSVEPSCVGKDGVEHKWRIITGHATLAEVA